MSELTMCMAGAILLLVVACALLWAQIAWLKADIKNLQHREFEICRFCNKLRDGEKPLLHLAEICYCDFHGEHHDAYVLPLGSKEHDNQDGTEIRKAL